MNKNHHHHPACPRRFGGASDAHDAADVAVFKAHLVEDEEGGVTSPSL